MHKIYSTILFCFLVGMAFGQREMSTGNLGHLWQSNAFNPSYIQPNKVTVTLFNTFANAGVSGFTPKDMYYIENDTLFLQASNAFSDKNELRVNTEFTPLALDIKIGENTSIGLDYGVYGEGNLYFNDGLTDLILEGNAPFVGEDKRIEGNIHLNAFTSTGLRFATRLDKWQVGVKLKYISGFIHINTDTDNNNFTVNTDANNYGITATSNYALYYTDQFTITGDSIEFDDSNMDFVGSGVGLDLGAQYQFSEKLTLGLAVTDIGSISFRDMKKSSSSTQASYAGENLNEVDSEDFDLGESVESFLDTFNFRESRGDYTYSLPTRLFLNGRYQATERLMLSGALVSEWYNGTNETGVSVGANYDIIPRFINMGLSVGARNGSFNNLGFNATLAALPFEIFFVTDNILGLGDISNVNGRFGINLRFGNPKKSKLKNDDVISN